MNRIGVMVMAVVALSGCFCSFTEADFRVVERDANTCTAADTCVVTTLGLNACTCSSVVRQSELANVEAAAKRVWCGGKMAKCAVWVNPRCEAGVCVADQGH